MKSVKNIWSYEELILAFNLYCKLGFTKINASNKSVKELAYTIGRSNNAVAIKLANFARLDPALQSRKVAGMSHGSHGEETVWQEFNSDWEKLAYESELILARYKGVEVSSLIEENGLDIFREGKEREATVRERINQGFFRKMILTSYNNTCCITGIRIPELLIASHIIPWKDNIKERINPHNGLCLNALHDKTFDKGLLTVTADYTIKISEILKSQLNEDSRKFFLPYENKKIRMPDRFFPDTEFLYYHSNNIYIP